jgi:hypothetical protein
MNFPSLEIGAGEFWHNHADLRDRQMLRRQNHAFGGE